MNFQIKLSDKEELSRALGIEDARAISLTKELCEKRMRDKQSYKPLEEILGKCQTIEEIVLVASCYGCIITQ